MRIPPRRYRLALILLCAFLSISAFAQSSPYKPGSPLLMWKLSSKTNSAYLLGSVHLGDKSLYPLPGVIEDAFAASSVLIVEVDMSKVDKAQMQQLTMSLGFYPPDDNLFKHITPETRAKLTEFLSGSAIPPEAFAHFRPWMARLMIVMLPMLKSGMDPNDGIDMNFLNRAGNKRVEQLEDAAFQIKLLSSIPDTDTDRDIMQCLTQAQKSDGFLSKASSYWSHGEADKFEALMASMDNTPDGKALQHRLIQDRNPNMADRLEKCLQSSAESCFMVVGAAHVIGPEGIVRLMQARGYKAEQAVVETPAAK